MLRILSVEIFAALTDFRVVSRRGYEEDSGY